MLDWLTNTLPVFIGGFSVFAFVLVFLGGVITSIGPCNLAMVPLIMAYVGGQEDVSRSRSFWLSLFFTFGSATTFMLLGIIIALIGGIFGSTKSILYYVVAAVCIIIGLNLLKIINLQFPGLTGLQSRYKPKQGFVGSYFLGMVLGLAGSQCGTPILFAILSIVMLKGNIAYGAALLFFYAIGRGVPVVAAGTFTGIIKNMPVIEKWSRVFESAAGVILITIGVYFLWIA